MKAIAQEEVTTGTEETRPPRVPPRWFVHGAWRVHRGLYKLSRGRFLWSTSNKRGWGALRLTTLGRKSGQERSVIVGYVEDGPNLVLLAMNGWGEGHPSWRLNLAAHPDAAVGVATSGSSQSSSFASIRWARSCLPDRSSGRWRSRRRSCASIATGSPRRRTS